MTYLFLRAVCKIHTLELYVYIYLYARYFLKDESFNNICCIKVFMLSPKPSDSLSLNHDPSLKGKRTELDDKGKRDRESALPLAVIGQSPAPRNGAASFARWNWLIQFLIWCTWITWARLPSRLQLLTHN